LCSKLNSGFKSQKGYKKVTVKINIFNSFRVLLVITLILTGIFSTTLSARSKPEKALEVITVQRGQLTATLGSNALCSTPVADIPDDGASSLTDSMELVETGLIADMDLAILIDHSWVGDLSVTLSHESTTVMALDRPGVTGEDEFGCSGANIDLILDDEAGSPADDMCDPNSDPAIFGTGSPSGLLGDFDDQDLSGTWTLEVTDAFADDGVPGILHSWCLVPVVAAVCSSPDAVIPDDDPETGVTDTIEVTESGNIIGMDVLVQINHTWVGDLSAVVSHGDKSVMLLDRPGIPEIDNEFGCGYENVDATFDDDATVSAEDEDQCFPNIPSIRNLLSPTAPLSGFNNQDFAGSWSLQVTDSSADDEGTLNRWCLIPVIGAPPETVFADGFEDQ